MKVLLSTRKPRLLAAAAAVSAGTLAAAWALASPASAGQAASTQAAGTQGQHTLTVRQIAFGENLQHAFQPNGTGDAIGEPLTDPDDLTELGAHIYVGFQNGVGSMGEPSASGDLDSTVVEFTLFGKEVAQWDVRGKVDGLTADPFLGKVIATVNEDGNSSLYTVSPDGPVTHYAYNEPLPHNGGTDAISSFRGQILISASAPGGTGAPAPQPAYPAVYAVTLQPRTQVATTRPLFSDEATAAAVNGPNAGTNVALGLTDPDSNEVVPFDSAAFGGDFMLDSQGDQELIFDHMTGRAQSLSVLSLPASVDDTAWATRAFGALYTTDDAADTLDIVYGQLAAGTAYTAVTPCNANSAPADCPAAGFPANYLGTVNLTTGALTPVPLTGAGLQPKGLIFVPF